jgi:hypothetical protein
MSGREPPPPTNPDDWFAGDGDEPASRRRGSTVEATAIPPEAPGAEDDWLGEEGGTARLTDSNEGFTVRLGTLLVAAAILLVLILVAGLAVGGVFSGGGTSGTTGTTTTSPAVTTTQTASTTPAHAVIPAPATTLKPGDTGAQVKRLQRALKRLGYSVGAVDGDYGTSTQAAVTRLQQASKLTTDGVLGPKSLQALKRALLAHG